MYLLVLSVNKPAVLRAKSGPRTLCEARKVAGSATYKQRMELCDPLKSVCLFSRVNKECLVIKRQSRSFSSSTKVRSAPLNVVIKHGDTE